MVLFLCGRCAVSRYSAEGDNLSYAVHEEAILLGLLEYLGGQPAVLATVSALDECWYLTFPGELFLEAVLSDRELTLKILRFLASFAGGSIDRVNELAQYTNRENVLLCLYRYSRGQPLPFVFKKEQAGPGGGAGDESAHPLPAARRDRGGGTHPAGGGKDMDRGAGERKVGGGGV